MIYNKSTHPIDIKKISIRLWGLRDEIEAAIGRRIKECEAAGVPLYIDDIKKFYHIPSNNPDNVVQLNQGAEAVDDSMASLMEEISEDATEEGNQKLSEAEEIIAEQKSQGLENDKPNPILDRPYQRQAPDLDKISYGFVLLSDINMENMLTFTKEKFLQGQSVTVEFLIPQSFMMTADVTYCHHYAMRSRIISSNKPDYRVQCRFAFAIPGERDTLRNFLKSIEPNLPAEKKKPKKEAEDDSLGL
jgi:hypothetical protein